MAKWWQDAVFYQVYPRSFQDSNGDGVGDLPGITSRLDYLVELGVDALWISPFYPSPQVDAGYDVADYCDVDPLFGDLADFDRLLKEAHARGIRVTIDLVPNHCSNQHAWFKAAVAAGRGSAERERFHFREGKGANGELPPNNWGSVFGGPSWTRVNEPDGSPGQWYYHLFASEQPDFNWEHPDVLVEFERVFRFWLDRGVDGFRIDVSDALIKDQTFPDTDGGYPVIPKDDGSKVHEIYRHFRRVMDEYPGDRMAVIETGADDDIVALFIRPDEMHLAFNFRFLKSPWSAEAYRNAVRESVAANRLVGAPNTWVLDNHDNPRSVTRYGRAQQLVGNYVPTSSWQGEVDLDLGWMRTQALSLLLFALPGAVYIYNGQELGLPNVDDLPEHELQDPVFKRTGGRERGRDGCRVPMPWEGNVSPFGFSDRGVKPWLSMPPHWRNYAVGREGDDWDSMLALYQGLIAERAHSELLRRGNATVLDSHADLLVVEIEHHGLRNWVVVNFGEEPVALPRFGEGEVVYTSDGADITRSIHPNTAALLR